MILIFYKFLYKLVDWLLELLWTQMISLYGQTDFLKHAYLNSHTSITRVVMFTSIHTLWAKCVYRVEMMSLSLDVPLLQPPKRRKTLTVSFSPGTEHTDGGLLQVYVTLLRRTLHGQDEQACRLILGFFSYCFSGPSDGQKTPRPATQVQNKKKKYECVSAENG